MSHMLSTPFLYVLFCFYYNWLQFLVFQAGSYTANPTSLVLCIKINTQVYLQILQTLTAASHTHPGWESSAWCPSVTPWPLLALLPCCPYTVGLLSPDRAWGQTFWEVKGRGMRWWCHRGCWRVARRVGGGLSQGSQSHTRLTVLCSQPVGTHFWTELPLMALNSAWWLALI